MKKVTETSGTKLYTAYIFEAYLETFLGFGVYLEKFYKQKKPSKMYVVYVQLFLQFIFCLCSGRIFALRNLVLLWVCKMFVPTPRNLIKLYYISWSLHFSANWDKFFWRMGALALSLSEKFNFPARISYLSLVRFTHADCRVLSLSWRYYVQYTTTKKKFGNPINYMLNYNLKSDQTEV